jgi:hypothetical protein
MIPAPDHIGSGVTMSWSEVDWLEVAGCLAVGVPALAVGIRRLTTGPDKYAAQRWLYWGLGMIALAGAAVMESTLDWYATVAGIAVAVACFAMILVSARRHRRAR